MYNIAIIGAGQLGSRHLQSLASIAFPIHITVIDPFQGSLDTAKTRWLEMNPAAHLNIQFLNSIALAPKELDIVIVASNANVRKNIIQSLVEQAKVKYLILEKVLFQHLDDYDEIAALLKNNNIKTWVNCPRRMYSYYNALKEKLNNSSPFQFTIQGNNWGMGCNTIHFLDLFHYLTFNDDIINTSSILSNEIVGSKREGFIEFNGQFLAETKNGNSFLAISRSSEVAIPSIISITSKDISVRIIESLKKVFIINNAGEVISEEVVPLFQSQLTSLVVNQLIEKGECELTTYDESSNLHTIMLNEFLKHYNKIYNSPNNKLCPIT